MFISSRPSSWTCAFQKLLSGRGSLKTATRPRRSLNLEMLEDRTVPAMVNWIGGTNSDWDTSSNWSTGSVPGSIDCVVIGQLGGQNAFTVSHDGNYQDTVKSLVSYVPLEISNGSLTVLNSSTVATLQLNGGTVSTNADLHIGYLSDNSNYSTFAGTGIIYLDGGTQANPNQIIGNVLALDTNLVSNGVTTSYSNYVLASNVSITNNGTWQTAGYCYLEAQSGATNTAFVNNGLFDTPNNAYTIAVDLPFSNYGSVVANSGTITFNGNVTSTWRHVERRCCWIGTLF